MSVHRWSSDDKSPGDGRFTFARRWFILWGPDNHREDAHLDVYVNKKPGHGWGGYLRFDGPHAETPIDAALFLGRFLAVFAGTSKGRRLNRFLRVQSPSADNRWQTASRQLELRLSVGHAAGKWAQNALVQWALWTDPEHTVFGKWNRDEMRAQHGAVYTWMYEHLRRGYHHPIKAILDTLLGKTVHTVTESEPHPAVVCLPEGEYPVTVTLEHRTWKRPRSPRAWLRTTMVDIECVPVSGGGTGFCPTGKVKYGVNDGVCSTTGGRELTPYEAADPGKWVAVGVATFTERVLKERARHRHPGWVPPHPTDRETTV